MRRAGQTPQTPARRAENVDNNHCVGGFCRPLPGCGTGETLCGDACVVLTPSVRNCGARGCVCAPAYACIGGTCRLQCNEGRIDRGAGVDPLRDNGHCGACGVACAPDESCTAGACVSRAAMPVGPMSGSLVTTPTPRFVWRLASGVDGVVIEVCATRACEAVLHCASVVASDYAMPAPLPPPLARGPSAA